MWRARILPVVSHALLPAWNDSWFFLSPASHWWASTLVISRAASVVSGLAFVFFLIALACQRGPSQNADKRASRRVQIAALVAIFVGAISIITLLIVFRVYGYGYGPARMGVSSVLSELRSLLFALPDLIAPLIILVSVTNALRSERQVFTR